MSTVLHLNLVTPAEILFDSREIVALRAEDESGSFGILPGHADLLTVLVPTVLRWRDAKDHTGFCAVDGGVLRVSDGTEVHIACRDGVLGESLQALQARVVQARAARLDAARRARTHETRAHARLMRELVRYLRASPARGSNDEAGGLPPGILR